MSSNKKENLIINDFKLFLDTLKSFSKLTNSCKITFNSNGFSIYGKNMFARGEVTSNSICADKEISVCVADLSMLIKLLGTANSIHESDDSDLKLIIDLPFIKIESGKFKTKLTTCKEEIITGSISQEIKTVLTPIFEFTTSTEQIKTVNAHSFILPDQDIARIYLTVEPKMENNVLYATIGNDSNDLNNSVTLKFAMVNSGILDKKIILNFDRLNLFNIINTDQVKIQLMDRNVLLYNISINGKNNSSYYNFKIYCSLLNN
jgi:hypothetical protein